MGKRTYHHYCYLVHDHVNDMYYFGKRASEKPPEQDKYMGSGKKLLAAMKEHGKERFSKKVLAVFDNEHDCGEFEDAYMAEHDCVDDPKYYNLSWKSTGGRFDYHEDLKDDLVKSPQEKNGAQKNFPADGASATADPRPTDFIARADYTSKSTTKKEVPEKDETYTKNIDGSPDGRIHHKGQMGGKRPGAGRPKGSKSIFSKKSVEKLGELQIDPIEELVKTYQQVCEDIEQTKSVSARTSLYNTRQKIMSELIKYGYRPVPREEKKEVTNIDKGPMSIILTDTDDEKPETKH